MSMDIIYLTDLRIDTVIGVFDWEKRIKQTLILDLEMGTDIRKAGATDDLQYTLDYGEVAKRVVSFVEESRFDLIESVAEGVANIILNEFKVPWMRLKINKKGAVENVRDVGVIIERSRDAQNQ